ncbi:MAG: alanine racemase [Candidatus Omnitrophota bacterium]|nr:alanine racemase [Candidatus Omnitrophota bacterium]
MVNKQMTHRATWAEIDLGAVRYNYRQVKKLVGKQASILVIVKGNAYGHGMFEVAKTLENAGIDFFGVATLDEALYLREKRIKKPILVLGSVLPAEAEPAVKNNITLTLCHMELAKAIDRAGAKLKKKADVHIKIDTGMGRIGVWHEGAFDFVRDIVFNFKNISVGGIYTHFSVAGRDEFFTTYQLDAFNALLEELKHLGIDIPYRHTANSIATVALKKAHLNLVRPGIIIYGMYPKRSFSNKLDLKPVMSLKTKIVFLKKTQPGMSISYGRTYITQKPTTIATLPIGYADGYGRILSNKAKALVRGETAPVVGKVTMDQTMIDVGHIDGVKLGDEVVLIGRQGGNEIKCEELARLAGTIPYEIVCSISNRVPRIYKGR